MKIKKLLTPLLLILLLASTIAFGTSQPMGPYYDDIYLNYSSDGLTVKQNVTTVTTTHTMTVAEQGVVLVSASSDYTITLPTTVGNTGLTYKFKKTDANYNCITLDGNGSETINYENADGVPKETYARLNTYGAEVTLVSDGSNWQAYDEKLGQVPECWAYLSSSQTNITDNTITIVNLDTIYKDIGSNFNTTTHRFIAPISGEYSVAGSIMYDDIVTDKDYHIFVCKNGNETYDGTGFQFYFWFFYGGTSDYFKVTGSNNQVSLAATDYIDLRGRAVTGENTVDFHGSPDRPIYTYLQIRLISKD